MWQQFTVKNFRCFSSLVLQPLARVNLIAGKNNTGKTTLLEAIHLHGYPENCKLLFDIPARRGMAEGPPYEGETAQWLFCDGHAGHGFELSSQNGEGDTRTLQVWFLDSSDILPAISASGAASQGTQSAAFAGAYAPVVMRTEENGRETFAVGLLTPFGIAFSGNEASWRGRSIYLSSTPQAGESDLQAFSEVESANRQEEVLASLHIIEPRLQRLSLLMLGGKPVIHGAIGLSRLVPSHSWAKACAACSPLSWPSPRPRAAAS